MKEFDDLLDSHLLLVTGKGGIGKSFTAAALAIEAATRGKRVCLIEANPEDQLSPLFGFPPVRHQFRDVHPGVNYVNLDLHKNFRDFFVKHLGFEQVFDRLLGNAAVSSLLKFIPGLLELTLLGRFYYEARLNRQRTYDLVIFDGYASGHFLNLMTTPAAIFQSRVVGPLLQETERVENFLREPTTSVVMVTVAEPLIASECIEFCQLMAEKSPASVRAVLVNRFPAAVDAKFAGKDGARQPAWEYASMQRLRAESALQSMAKPLAEFQDKHSKFFTAMAPDLGIVAEPLSVETVSGYFQRLHPWLSKTGAVTW